LKGFKDFYLNNGSIQGQNLALTALSVPSSLALGTDSPGRNNERDNLCGFVASPLQLDLLHKVRDRPLRCLPAVHPGNHSIEMEAGSYLRRIDSFITQLKAQGPSRTCNESNEEEERGFGLVNRFPSLIKSG